MTPDTPTAGMTDTHPAAAPGTPAPGDLTLTDLAEIQGLVVYGTRMPCVRYLFFKVRAGAAVEARRFVRQFSPGGPLAVTTAATAARDESASVDAAPSTRPEHRLYIAFTASGLRRLGLVEEDIQTFPDDFVEGARKRAELIGDTGANAPEHWTLTDDDIDIAVLLYAREATVIEEWRARIIEAASGCDLAAERSGATLEHLRGERDPQAPRHEHFGFADGISQPRLRSVPSLDGKAADARPEVAPGLFILGHPDKEGPSLNPVDMARSITFDPLPKPEPLGRNGSFAALRIMAQDCDAFERFLEVNTGGENGDAVARERERLAARVVGRWKDGSPLALTPDRPSPAQGRANDFDYRDDPHGARCPLGAHARRANPRGTVVLGGNGDAVRLIRRGMPYGDPYEKNDGKERGLLGLFFCASLKHQFEFIMKHWVNDGLFARGLPHDHKDPLIGSHELGAARFSYPTSAGVVDVDGLTRFVTTRGAAYLFFPGTKGLAFLSNPDHTGPELPSARVLSASALTSLPSQAATPTPSDDQLIAMIQKGIVGRVSQTRHRDAHAKHHGIVRATFRVLPDVPARLRHGIFATPAAYPAYVRFSNGRVDPKPGADGQPLPNEVAFPHDALPDARGMAIKVMKVPGDKLLADVDGERATQDFILVNHETFFAGSLPQYMQVLAQARTSPEVLAPFFHSHASPLTTEYFSQTAYALGADLVARYRALPVSPAPEAPLTPAEYSALAAQPEKANYLQETLAAQLASAPATFDFLVQVPDEGAAVDADDASQRWEAPYYRVARIEIPSQWFLSMLQQHFARDISFNPWHSLAAHRPLGPINRARREVYVATAQARRALLPAPCREPDGSETF